MFGAVLQFMLNYWVHKCFTAALFKLFTPSQIISECKIVVLKLSEYLISSLIKVFV